MARTLLTSFLGVFIAAASATSQETTTGTISGRVQDEQGGVLPGATVQITSEQGRKEVTTDERGRFLVPFLTPGAYSVRVEMPGFSLALQENVQVRLGQRTDLSFTLSLGAVSETITVKDSAPVVDTTSTTTGGVLDSEFLVEIPLGRQLADVLTMSPGVSDGGLTGSANPSMAGGAGLDNQYYIDGVNVSDNGFGSLGVYSRAYGSMGQGATYEFLDEIEVKTGGYEAEYGQSTGGVVNVITKSGTNEFRGSVFGFSQTDGLEADRKNFDDWENGRSTPTHESQQDVGVTAGGPIAKDRVFFFGAFHPQFIGRDVRAPASFPLASLGEVDRTRRFLSYATKGSFNLGTGHRVDASFFGDPSQSTNAPQSDSGAELLREEASAFSRLEFSNHQQIVKYSGILTSSWLLEGSFARAHSDFDEFPSVDQWSVIDRTVTPNVRTGGIGFFENSEGTNKQWTIKSTNFVGPHQIRYGFSFEDISFDASVERTGPTFILPNGVPTVTGASVSIQPDPTFGRIFRVTRANTENVRDTTQDYLSFFAQDQFEIGHRLTISAGIRYEEQQIRGNLTGFDFDNNWAPRLGAIYDPTGRGRAKIYGNWGRFFAKLPQDLAARAFSADAGVTRADYFDANLTMPVPEGVEALGTTRHLILAGTSASVVDPDAKSSFVDEAIAGFEFEALPELNIGVRYIYRDLGRVLEDTGNTSLTLFFTDPEAAGDVEFLIANIDDDLPTLLGQGAFEKPIREYQAVEVTAEKRISNNWGLLASYRWSRLWGNFEGFFRNDNGQSDPGITSLFDFPVNDPTFAELAPELGFRGDIRLQGRAGAGRLPNDRDHQIKVFTTYSFPMGLDVGVSFRTGSGRPLTPLASNPVFDNAGEIPEAPRGSGIETQNGFKDRADWITTLDFHADYGISAGDWGRVTLVADLFNVFSTEPAIRYNENTELQFGVPDPDFGRVLAYGAPFRARFGVRFEF